ncbi:hypothetical protein BpHYR1_002668, partial [Brachionus plicatilis]
FIFEILSLKEQQIFKEFAIFGTLDIPTNSSAVIEKKTECLVENLIQDCFFKLVIVEISNDEKKFALYSSDLTFVFLLILHKFTKFSSASTKFFEKSSK